MEIDINLSNQSQSQYSNHILKHLGLTEDQQKIKQEIQIIV